MAELTNSQRKTYKATYAPIQRDPKTDVQASNFLTRAVEKAGFVRSLDIHQAELPLLRTSIQQLGGDATQQKQLSQALEMVEQLATNSSPSASIGYASDLAKVDSDTLIKLGHLLASTRRTLENEVATALQQIRVQYITVHQQPETAAVGVPPSVSTKQSTPLQLSPTTISTSNMGRAKANILAQRQQDVATSAQQMQQGLAQPVNPPSLSEIIEWAAMHRIPQIEDLYARARMLSPAQPAYSQLGVRAAILKLLIKIQHWADMTVNATNNAEQQFHIDPVGRLHLERIEMTPVGIERGELVHSVPLTPKETVNISHKEWATTTQEFESIVQDSFEGYSEEGVAEKNDFSQATESDSKHATALDVGASLSASYSSVTLSSSFGYKATSDDHQAHKDSRNHSSSITRKASARTKKDHKFSFKVSSVAGAEDLAVRVITNPSDKDAMRVDYYQLIRKWKVDLLRYGLRMTYDIAIPSPGVALLRKLEELRELDALIEAPPNFPLQIAEITPDNSQQGNSWIDLAVTYKASVEPPPQAVKYLNVHKEFDISQDAAGDIAFDSLDFEVDDGYEVNTALFTAIWNMWKHDKNGNVIQTHEFYILALGTSLLGSTYLQYLDGTTGKHTVIWRYQGLHRGSASLQLIFVPQASTMDAWRIKAWNTMREAYEEAYYKDREILKERRAKLAEEIGKEDALTLRQMEKEEVMKQVLRWLFGPQFELVPSDIQQMFTPCDPKDPSCIEVLNVPAGRNDWLRVIEFGEMIKFLHQAIEWENVLYFSYPYFWDSPDNWNFKLFLDHPDPLHRKFLRAGSSRVVLTVRPGFEESFTCFLESGDPYCLSQDKDPHPYLTIAQEIANFAQTNYPGIPPANPAVNARPLLYPRQRKAWDEMQQIMQLVNVYFQRNGKYPSTLTDLQSVVPYTDPSGMHPTITSVPLQDPWAHDYVYTFPGQYGDYDLVSYGADGKPGGTDEDADITSWAEASLTATWYEYTPTSALDISINTVLAELA
ncbi:MAG: type II secretion system protein GspG [Ktedonobacteraceae bacterium]